MTVAPSVSALICFLNAERFLREAVESVYAQTFSDWELLLIDDGSRDGSAAIAQRACAERPDRVRVLSHPGRENRGISASRNLGIRNARGRYIAFLDADDVWLPEKLARQLALLDANTRVAMTYGSTRRWHSWTGERADARRDLVYGTGLPSGSVVEPPGLLRHYLDSGGEFVPGICSWLVRRDAILAVDGFDDRFRGTFEDQVFLSKLTARYPVLVTDDCTTLYRQHPESCCAAAVQSGEYDVFLPNSARERYLKWLGDHLEQTRCVDPDVQEALRRQLRPYRNAITRSVSVQVPRLLDRAKRATKRFVRAALPPPVPRWLKSRIRGRAYVPPAGWVRFGDLRRMSPISRDYGYDRGTPIDRYYIERFVQRHAADVRGRTLEIGDATYTRRFGGNAVSVADVLHVSGTAPGATIVCDLATAEHLPSDAFDCFILTQTLQFIFDLPAAVATIHRILRPGGVVLGTIPGLSQLADQEWGHVWHWNLTPVSARRLFEARFAAGDVDVVAHGNVLAATAFLQGIAAGELRAEELDFHDPAYPVLITVRATKSLGVSLAESNGQREASR